jgi:fucose 4-O-acetylase-like acetyltransferase
MLLTKTDNTRLDWIDYAKGIGIIFVVFGHVIKGLNSAHLIDPTFYYYAVNLIYSFHMPLFFMLSGYFFLASLNKRGNKSFLITKLETIAYPYLIWNTIQTFIEMQLSSVTNSHINKEMSLAFLYKPQAQFWFMFALFFINVFSLLLFNISKKWGVILSIIVWIIYYTFNLKADIFDKTLANLIYFTVGIALSVYPQFIVQLLRNKYLLLLNLICFCFSLYIYFNYSHKLLYNQIVPQLSGSFIIIYIGKMFSEISWLKFLEILGINSMIIYLVHILAGSGTRIILSKVFHITNSPIHIILGTLAGLIVPLLFYRFVKKTRYLVWLFVLPSQKKIIVRPI